MKGHQSRPPRKRTKPTLQHEAHRLHLSVFVSNTESMLLREELLDDLKAALLYATKIDLYCAEAQFTLFVQDLLNAPAEQLYNIARGHETNISILAKHGQAGPYAIQRILTDHLPELASAPRGQALKEIDRLRDWIRTESNEDIDGQKTLASLQPALDTGRVKLRDWVRTGKALDAPYKIDYVTPLQDALKRSDTAVLCDATTAAHVRKDAAVSYPARERATSAALGTGFIARLPAFPDAKMDEILSLESDADAALRRYRAAMASFRGKMNESSPFDPDFHEHLHNLWSSEVLPTIADLEERYKETGWLKYIWDRRESIAIPAALAVMAISVAPHLAFLDPQVQALASDLSPLLGTYATTKPLWKARTNVRLDRRQVEQNSLFYLTALDSRLRH